MKASIEGKVIYVAEEVVMDKLYETIRRANIPFPPRARVVVVEKEQGTLALIIEYELRRSYFFQALRKRVRAK